MTSRLRVALCFVVAGTVPAAAAEAPHLERVVVLERHGVRAPAASANRLFERFGRELVPWSVPPGELSPHGAVATRLLGAHLRAVYAAAGLFPATGCPASDTLFVWADTAYQRTRASGDALAAGLAPGCGFAAHYAADGTADALFEPRARSDCPVDSSAEEAAILAEAGGSLAALRPAYAGALDALQKRIDPDACKPSHISNACLADAPDRLEIHGKGVRLEGALADGAAMSESLFLTYADGQAGLTAADVTAVMPLHEVFARILRRPIYNAARGGGPLLRRMLAVMAGDDAPDAVPPVPKAARYVTFLGHDVNLSHLAALLGVDWKLPGEPDNTAPDTALAFEVWRAPESPPFVKLRLYYQTLDQLRTLQPLAADAGANGLDLSIPGCDDGPDGRCTVARLTTLMAAEIAATCAPTSEPGVVNR